MSSQINTSPDAGSKAHTTENTRQKKPTADKQKRAAKAIATPPAPTRKPDLILSLLRRAKGATIDQLKDATGWQAHSIRAVLSGLRKKGIAITRSNAKDGASLYHANKS